MKNKEVKSIVAQYNAQAGIRAMWSDVNQAWFIVFGGEAVLRIISDPYDLKDYLRTFTD